MRSRRRARVKRDSLNHAQRKDQLGTRRNFIKCGLVGLIGLGLSAGRLLSHPHCAWAGTGKTIVPKGTKQDDLRNKNPRDLDTSSLEITPIKDFGTMGLDDYDVDIEKWRLLVEGEVAAPLSLSYDQVINLACIERTVLMICPGVFVNNGVWKGVPLKELLKMAQVKPDVNYVTFRGPMGNYEKAFRSPIQEALADKVFLAYHVNGRRLPRKHGFPLRLVAEGYHGYEWVKYVYKVTADVIKEEER